MTFAKEIENLQINGEKRNYGIDFLRIVSMIFVLVLHILGHGGVLVSSEFMSAKYSLLWLLETLAFCSVNCYAIISGYVGYSSKFRLSNIVELYLTVIFYTLGITAAFAVLVPGSVDILAVAKAIFPFINGGSEYWYFTAYFCAFFFFPYLKKLVDVLEKRAMQKLIALIVLLFSVMPTLLNIDIFYVHMGYSALWLAMLYIIGAYLKKYEVGKNMKPGKGVLIIAGCVIVTWALKFIFDFFVPITLNGAVYGEYLIQYTSPAILAAAVAAVIVCANMKVGKAATKLIKVFAPLAFSVYLIHCEPLIWTGVFANRFAPYASFSTVFTILAVLGTALGIWLVCSLVDLVRFYLFKLFRIRVLSEKIAAGISKLGNKCFKG